MRPGSQMLLLVVLAFVGFGAVSELYVFRTLAAQEDARIQAETRRARRVYNELQGVEAKKKIAEVRTQCLTPELMAALALDDPSERHFAVFKEAHVLAQARLKADLLIVLDNDGIAIARNIDAKYQGTDLSDRPLVKEALAGQASVGVWLFNGEYDLVSAVPIEQAGQVIGALVAGNTLGKQTAEDNTALLGGEFFLLGEGRVLAATLGNRDSKALQAYMEEHRAEVGKIFAGAGGAELEPLRIPLPSGTYWAVFSDFNQAIGGEEIGYAILRSVTTATAGLRAARSGLLVIGGIGLLVFLAWAVLIARATRAPVDALFLGAQEVLHGNKDYQWDQEAGGDLGAVGGTLNALAAYLQGKELPDEDASTESWEESLLIQDTEVASTAEAEAGADTDADADAAEPAPPGSGAAESAAAPVEPAGEEYYQQLYQDYLTARKQCGEPIAGISAEKFTAKIKQNERVLAKKHDCRGIRFEVSVSGGKAALQAHPIK